MMQLTSNFDKTVQDLSVFGQISETNQSYTPLKNIFFVNYHHVKILDFSGLI